MTVAIAVETPLSDDVRAMVAALNAYLQPLSPPEFQFQLTAEEMTGPDVTVFVARNDAGRAVGMGSLMIHDEVFGEVKRMYTDPSVRGAGVGRMLLNAVEEAARRRGLHILRLETGATPGFEPAWRIYERGGFTRCCAFADYPDSEYSAFYEKTL
jgi:putative acetyltransferase